MKTKKKKNNYNQLLYLVTLYYGHYGLDGIGHTGRQGFFFLFDDAQHQVEMLTCKQRIQKPIHLLSVLLSTQVYVMLITQSKGGHV